MNYTVRRFLGHFSAAHRLPDYDGKCSYLHGHNYGVAVTLTLFTTAETFFDFAMFKEVFKKIIWAKYDHKTILREDDSLADYLEESGIVLLPYSPTCENMVADITRMCGNAILEQGLRDKYDISNIAVILTETEDCGASMGMNFLRENA